MYWNKEFVHKVGKKDYHQERASFITGQVAKQSTHLRVRKKGCSAKTQTVSENNKGNATSRPHHNTAVRWAVPLSRGENTS